MRYAVAALALAGAVMAGEGYPEYNTKSADPVYPDPAYPTKEADPVYPPAYPTGKDDPVDPPVYPTTYDPAYPTYSYPVKSDDPITPYPYPTGTKKADDVYPTTSCTSDLYKGGKDHDKDHYYPTSKYDHDHDVYTTSTIYETKVYYVTKGHDVETKTDKYAVTTTVYPVKTKEAEYPEKEHKDYKPTYPVSKAPEQTKKYEAEKPSSCPGYSVKTIHTSVTTVVPTVLYETVAVPCSTYKPIPTGSPNGTYPKYPPVTAGASSFAVSGLVAAVAGLAAAAFL